MNNNNWIHPLFSIFLMLIASSISANELSVVWEVEDLNMPESVLYDDERNILFVSNIVGSPLEKDSKGYISVLSLHGKIKTKYWIDGLNAPKGLARYKNLIYVADLDTLLEINIDNGKVLNRYFSRTAKFLNDVVVDKYGVVYVSDMFANKIYRLNNGEFNVWLEDEALENPNGLYIDDENLIVGSWGIITEGFNTEVPGHLKIISLETQSIASLGKGQPVGNLDGVESDGKENFYVTDWMNGGLYLISRDGKANKLLDLARGSADLEVILEERLILIPKMLEHKLTAYRIH